MNSPIYKAQMTIDEETHSDIFLSSYEEPEPLRNTMLQVAGQWQKSHPDTERNARIEVYDPQGKLLSVFTKAFDAVVYEKNINAGQRYYRMRNVCSRVIGYRGNWLQLHIRFHFFDEKNSFDEKHSGNFY